MTRAFLYRAGYRSYPTPPSVDY